MKAPISKQVKEILKNQKGMELIEASIRFKGKPVVVNNQSYTFKRGIK